MVSPEPLWTAVRRIMRASSSASSLQSRESRESLGEIRPRRQTLRCIPVPGVPRLYEYRRTESSVGERVYTDSSEYYDNLPEGSLEDDPVPNYEHEGVFDRLATITPYDYMTAPPTHTQEDSCGSMHITHTVRRRRSMSNIAPQEGSSSSSSSSSSWESEWRPPWADLPTTNLPTTHLPTTHLPTTHLPTTHLPTTNLSTTNLPTTNLSTTNLPTTNLPTTDLPTTNLPTTNPPPAPLLPPLPTTSYEWLNDYSLSPRDPLNAPEHDCAGEHSPTRMSVVKTMLLKTKKSIGGFFGRKSDVQTQKDLPSWTRYPSHTRAERNESARVDDQVSSYDFATEYQPPALDFDVPNLYDRPRTQDIKLSTMSKLKRRSKASLGRLYNRKKSLQSLKVTKPKVNKAKKAIRKLVPLFKGRGSSGRTGRRSSVSVGGTVEYPELEQLPGQA